MKKELKHKEVKRNILRSTVRCVWAAVKEFNLFYTFDVCQGPLDVFLLDSAVPELDAQSNDDYFDVG